MLGVRPDSGPDRYSATDIRVEVCLGSAPVGLEEAVSAVPRDEHRFHPAFDCAGLFGKRRPADKEVRELLGRRDAILARAATGPPPSALARSRGRAALEELVPRINASIARVNAQAPTDRQQRRPLTLADELARYDEACRR